jgi:alpha-beta hydrolase superfamily lysophospholipase
VGRIMFNASDAQVLRESLPDLDLNAGLPIDGSTAAYLQFYGLDVESLCPARAQDIRHSMGAITSAGFRIACHYYAPPPAQLSGTVVLVHGYYDHIGLYTHLLRYCLARNLAVLAFDLPGHGLSNGEPAAIDSFDQYTRVFSDCLQLVHAAQANKPVHVLAQSTGGAIVMDYCLNHCASSQQLIDKIVLLAPLVRPVAWRRGRLKYAVARRFIKSIKRSFAINSHDTEFLLFLSESDPLQCRLLPVAWVGALQNWLRKFENYEACNRALTVVQGTGDTTVDWRYNLTRIKEKFPYSETVLLPAARHHLANESQEIRDALCKELDRFL